VTLKLDRRTFLKLTGAAVGRILMFAVGTRIPQF